MNIFKPVIVFSAWRAHVSEQKNRETVAYVKREMDTRGIPYCSALGCYKGQTEPAIVVTDTPCARSAAQAFARLSSKNR